MSDPTMRLVKQLKDPAAWAKVERGVPVFVPHERDDPDGNPVAVDVPRLKKIARNINLRFEKKGVPLILTEGHRYKDRATGQWKRTPVLSYGINARVGAWGPDREPGILIDQYVPDAECLDAVRGLPFRSAEFYPESDQITSVALLRNDPALDMGVVSYQERERRCLFYSLEYAMDDEHDLDDRDDDTDPDPARNPGDDTDDDDTDDGQGDIDPEKAEEFKRYMQSCFPKLHAMASGGGEPGPQGGHDDYGLDVRRPARTPAPKPKNKPPKARQDDPDMLHYERRQKELDGRLAGIEKRERLLVYERELQRLHGAGYEFSLKAELEDAADEDRAAFDRHKKRIVTNYRRRQDPTLYETVPVGDSPDADDLAPADPHRETDLHKEAMVYLRENPGMAYEKAVQEVKKNRPAPRRQRGRQED